MFRFTPILFFIIWANHSVRCATLDIAQADKKVEPKICESAACKKIAIDMLEKMNKSADPCDDFYEFACGNFAKNAIIPDDQSSTSLFSSLRKQIQLELRASIENEITEKDPRSFKILKSFYDTCMDEDQVNRKSEKELLGVLKKLGEWPVLAGESWKPSSFDWKRTIQKFREFGFSYGQFMSFGVDSDMKNSTRRILTLDQASLGLSQEYLSQGPEQKVVKAYFKYMVDLAEIFGANRDQAEKELTESLNFEIELAKISLSVRDRRNITALYNPMTINELQTKYSYVPWRDYLNHLMSPYARLKTDEIINVAVPSFFSKLNELVSKTPKRVLANYALWRVVKQSAGSLSERVRNAQREFSASLSGNSNKKPRWQDCVSEVNDGLHLATGALYVRRKFNNQSKHAAIQMVTNLRAVFRQMLIKVDWMEDATKDKALDKLNDILPLIAYPDELLDDKTLDNFYKDLKVQPDSFFRTSLNYNLFATKWSFQRLRKPVLKNDWTENFGAASVVNAFYDASLNVMMFPAGILQGAFFDVEHPNYANYASIGSVVGHEMTHGFDDQGAGFDKNGNLVDWWDAETAKKFKKKTECIVQQYSGYRAKEVNLNLDGSLTQGENIADNGGLKQAYYAYDALQNKIDEEPRLPGFESFSSKQMFWISYANVWCAKYRPQYLSNLITTDPHAPAHFRVSGPVSNMPEFSRDFNCPAGSAMNPAQRCSVW